MKIVYKENPLLTQVILDDEDKKYLRAKLEIDELEEIIYSAMHNLQGDSNVEEALKDLHRVNSDSYYERIERQLSSMQNDLLHTHVGDCTCIPCSCIKCRAEYLLGIDTIAGLGKHEAHYIMGAFGHDGDKSIDEVIQYLSTPVSEEPSEAYKTNPELYRSCIPRWTQEKKRAHDWLVDYKSKGWYNDS